MSAVFLNVGQCGNQLGQSFWREVEEWTARSSKDSSRSSSSQRLRTQTATSSSPSTASKKLKYLPYSLLNGTLPCLWVDTEPKVIKSCSKSRSSSTLKERIPGECCIALPVGAGRGSNWAYGYHGRTKSTARKEMLRSATCSANYPCFLAHSQVSFHIE